MLPSWRCQILSIILVLSAMLPIFAIGSALLQTDAADCEGVIAFDSRQLKAAGKKCPVHDKELVAMKYAL